MPCVTVIYFLQNKDVFDENECLLKGETPVVEY
jgi:hypothetical protein